MRESLADGFRFVTEAVGRGRVLDEKKPKLSDEQLY